MAPAAYGAMPHPRRRRGLQKRARLPGWARNDRASDAPISSRGSNTSRRPARGRSHCAQRYNVPSACCHPACTIIPEFLGFFGPDDRIDLKEAEILRVPFATENLVRSKIKTGLHLGREHRILWWRMVSIRHIALSNAYDHTLVVVIIQVEHHSRRASRGRSSYNVQTCGIPSKVVSPPLATLGSGTAGEAIEPTQRRVQVTNRLVLARFFWRQRPGFPPRE